MIDSIETVFYSILFLVPGFIMTSIIDSINPRKKQEQFTEILRCLLYSAISDLFSFWVIKAASTVIEPSSWFYWCIIPIGFVLISTIIAFLVAVIKKYQLFRGLLKHIGINVKHSIPFAWDYVFNKSVGYFVVVTLKNGNQVYGLFNEKSFASSECENRDLFLEKIYEIKDHEWTENSFSAGLLINADDISTIEFMLGEIKNE